jgi:hypothetical protein
LAREFACIGAKFAIAFARTSSGDCPARKFFDGLGMVDKAKLMALFQIAADHGIFHNPEKFGDLGDGLFEFNQASMANLPRRSKTNRPGDSKESKAMKTQHEVLMEDPEFQKLFSIELLVAETSEEIARLMAELGVSKADLARRLNKSRAWVTQLLSGKSNMTIRTLGEVLYVLDAELKPHVRQRQHRQPEAGRPGHAVRRSR